MRRTLGLDDSDDMKRFKRKELEYNKINNTDYDTGSEDVRHIPYHEMPRPTLNKIEAVYKLMSNTTTESGFKASNLSTKQ